MNSFEGETRDWQSIARNLLLRALPVDPLNTQPDRLMVGANFTPVEISWIVRAGKQSFAASPPTATVLPSLEVYPVSSFLDQLVAESFSRRIALIGEGGTGKTLLLQELASRLLARGDRIPIWIPARALQSLTLSQYLREKWLSQAIAETGEAGRSDFEQFLQEGKVWLLIDGLDAIEVANTFEVPPSPLAAIARQLGDLPERVRAICSCRIDTWLGTRQALLHADVFGTRELRYPQEVEQFIGQLLNVEKGRAADLETPALFPAIEQPGRESLRSLLGNPLRLALLSRWWQQQHQPELPPTRSQLYRVLVQEFYQGRSGSAISHQQQQELGRQLAAWAVEMLETGTLLEVAESETPDSLRLALQLGWLCPLGVSQESSSRRKYGFSDKSFQEYFAAQAIGDWRYFLPEESGERASGRGIYRIFEPRWREVILFWLGRDDIEIGVKTDFFRAAIAFEDGCGRDNFYGQQAYLLAVMGLAEFPCCPLASELLKQAVAWGFDLKTLDTPLGKAARRSLAHSHCPSVLALLLERIANTDIESLYQPLLDSLAEIGKGYPTAIAALERQIAIPAANAKDWYLSATLGILEPGNCLALDTFLAPFKDDGESPLDPMVFWGLERIGKGSLKAIAVLLRRLLGRTSDQRRIFHCLEQIAQQNAMAIAFLVQSIRTTSEPGFLCQAAASLEKIDPGNPTAIGALVQLIQCELGEIRQEAIYSLGEMRAGNAIAQQALVDLLSQTDDLHTRWFAVSSLGKIGTRESAVVPALVTTIEQDDNLLLRKEAVDSLSKIDPSHPAIIESLTALMQQTRDEDLRREAVDRLGKLEPGNPDAITALSKLLQIDSDGFTRRQTAVSLGRIDPGNLDAITALMHLLQHTPESDLKSLAADSLGEIAHQNPAAIATLIRTVRGTGDREVCKQAVRALGQIAPGNREVIEVLTKQLTERDDEDLRLAIADSLISILSVGQMSAPIPALKARSLLQVGERDLPCHLVLQHCSQYLPYAEFYRAWHQSDLCPDEEMLPPLAIDLPSLVRESIRENPALLSKLNPIFIDSSQFIDPNDPPLDIYEQMLAQGCPEFEHGIPDSLSKLKLHWRKIQCQATKRHWVLIFYQNSLSQRGSLAPELLDKLSRFGGDVAAVCDRSCAGLPCFSPQDPLLLEAIGNWLTSQVS